MSLDVYLHGETHDVPCVCRRCFHEHMREETERLYRANVTHNLMSMAKAAGIYDHLWRPDEIGIVKAVQLIEPLRNAIAVMRADPYKFKAYNPKNGMGRYADFVPWIERYLAACEEYPDADVHVSR